MNEKKLNILNELFSETLLIDINDPQKCTPGLYQVIRGVLNDNKELLDGIPKETLDFLENKLSDSLPFKKEAG